MNNKKEEKELAEEHEITTEVIEQAKLTPNGFVYKIAGEWGDDVEIPGDAMVGAWKVNERGNIVGNFIPNQHFDLEKWKDRKINTRREKS